MLLMAASGPDGGSGARALMVAQVTVQETIVIRVPAQKTSRPKPMQWKLRKGPKCIPMASVAGAAVVAEDAVDFVLRGGLRVRAQFSATCSALDYYSGFYVLPTDDGLICANRDMIHTRAGGECAIRRFKKLIPIK